MMTRLHVRAGVVAGIFAVALGGCAEMSEMFSFGSDEERAAARAEAETAQLWEMQLMTGRYGAMLAQAREILNLPEPKATGDGFPTGNLDLAKQRTALAAYQVTVAKEFSGDVARACKRGRVPKKVRAHACGEQAKVPDELQTAVEPEVSALAARNDRVGDYVMPWWDTVCAVAPKPKDGTPACPME
jgi:hypothetical protein